MQSYKKYIFQAFGCSWLVSVSLLCLVKEYKKFCFFLIVFNLRLLKAIMNHGLSIFCILRIVAKFYIQVVFNHVSTLVRVYFEC